MLKDYKNNDFETDWGCDELSSEETNIGGINKITGFFKGLKRKKLVKESLDLIRYYKKKVIVAGLILLCLVGGFTSYMVFFRDKSDVKICQSAVSYNDGIGYTFFIGSDGKTIEKIEKHDKVSVDFIENNLTKENAKEILEEYKKTLQEVYNANVEKYKDNKYFESSITMEDDYISTVYTFNVGKEGFDYKENQALMEEFGVNYFYDNETNQFVYNEEEFLSDSTPLGGIEKVQCISEEK